MSCVNTYEIDLRGEVALKFIRSFCTVMQGLAMTWHAVWRMKHRYLNVCLCLHCRRRASPGPGCKQMTFQGQNRTHTVRVSLAGNKISAIENLGATEVPTFSVTALPFHNQTVQSECAWRNQDTDVMLLLLQNQFDSIDLSDNAIVRLDGFPKLPRLSWLLLCNNRIARIAPNLEGEAHQLLPPFIEVRKLRLHRSPFIEVRQHNASRQPPNSL